MGLDTPKLMKAGLATMALLLAAPVAAQTTAPASPAAPGAPATPAGNFSDTDLKQFAAVAIEVTKIQSDAAIPAADKQPKMLAAVQASGMPPEKFNAIGQAAAADPALQQRIQAAAAQAQPSSAQPSSTQPSPSQPAPAAPAQPAPPPQ